MATFKGIDLAISLSGDRVHVQGKLSQAASDLNGMTMRHEELRSIIYHTYATATRQNIARDRFDEFQGAVVDENAPKVC